MFDFCRAGVRWCKLLSFEKPKMRISVFRISLQSENIYFFSNCFWHSVCYCESMIITICVMDQKMKQKQSAAHTSNRRFFYDLLITSIIRDTSKSCYK